MRDAGGRFSRSVLFSASITGGSFAARSGNHFDAWKSVANFNKTYVWLVCVVAAMGGLLFGYDWVVIGGAKPFFERYFHLTDAATKDGRTAALSLAVCLALFWRAS